VSDDVRSQAIQRLHQRRGLLNYVLGGVIVCLFMIAIWFFTGQGYFWPGWVIGGFVLGALGYEVNSMMNKPFTDEQIDREIHKGS
jgi:hypothetical protein